MKCEQVQASLISTDIVLKDAPFGVPVILGSKLVMRLKPVNYLCNSTIINDAISKGNVTICDLALGTVYITDGSKTCKMIDSKLMWSKK